MNNNFENMMSSMMDKMMESMMEKMMESMMSSMMSSFGVATTPAEVEPEVKKTAKKLSVDDLNAAEKSEKAVNAELGYWESISKNGKPYRWFGWADPESGERVFPGKKLYHINDFYLKRDYGAYHPGKTTSYKFKDGGLNAVLTQYKVHTELDEKDAKEFIAFMKSKEDKKAVQAHDTDIYTNWCNHSK